MPSPDVVTYFGLELADLDEQQLMDNALAGAAEKFPDWTPREDNSEVVLLEQVAAMVANLGFLINQLPNGMAEVVLRLFGINRDPGQPPATVVRFTLTDTTGHTIPAGTVIRLDLGTSTDPVDFLTDRDLAIDPGADTGTIPASAALAGSYANGIPAGTVLSLLDAIAYVDSVVLEAPITGGTDPEDQLALLERAGPTLSRLTSTLVRATDVEAYVASVSPTITRVKVIDLYAVALPDQNGGIEDPDPPDGDPEEELGAPGEVLGSMVIVVAGVDASTIPQTLRSTVYAQVRNRMHAGLAIQVIGPNVYTVEVRTTVVRQTGAVPDDVEAAITAAVAAYLSPNTWTWSPSIIHNDLIAVVDGAAGVDTVTSVEVSAPSIDVDWHDEDLDFEGYAVLFSLVGVTSTVEDPA